MTSRDDRYWAAIARDHAAGEVDAVTRLVDAEVEAVEARVDALLDALDRRTRTQNATGEANDRLVRALTDFAQHGARFDLFPTHRDGDESFWHGYIARIDESIRARARAALDEVTP